jgi:hypothetical protein
MKPFFNDETFEVHDQSFKAMEWSHSLISSLKNEALTVNDVWPGISILPGPHSGRQNVLVNI